ncbi:MAG: hemolysin III family protein [Psychrobium sp.]|nr:hemolysin III family protein [Psychrobium sp.]
MTSNTIKIPAAYSQREETLNTWTHGVGAITGFIGLIVFIAISGWQQQWLKMVSLVIYGVSLTLLMSASAFYHHATDPVRKLRFKLFDHCAIYLLIAGTYTPLVTQAVPTFTGYCVLVMVWVAAIAGIFVKIKFGSQYKKFSVCTYLVMGWLSLFIIYELSQALDFGALLLLGLGGVIYSSGVYFYMNHKIAYNHAIWHLFVLIAAFCHYSLIFIYIL